VGREKLKEKITRNPKHVRFGDLDKLLRSYGFSVRQPGGGSSHYRYARERWQLTVPFKRPFVKEYYAKAVLELLEEIEKYEGES
jgi:hypothetical protein